MTRVRREKRLASTVTTPREAAARGRRGAVERDGARPGAAETWRGLLMGTTGWPMKERVLAGADIWGMEGGMEDGWDEK